MMLLSWGRRAGRTRDALLVFFGAVAGLTLLSATLTAQQAADCSGCHNQGDKLKTSTHAELGCTGCHEQHVKYPHPANVPKPACAGCHSSQAVDYARGVHGQAVKNGNAGAPDCAVCHGDVHEVQRAGTEAFRKTVPDTCGMCHTQVAEQFKQSVHGKAVAAGVAEAPVCTDCHGEHSILPHQNVASPVNPRQITETCGRCHADVRLTRRFGLPQDRITSFEASFHGLAGRSGSQTVANCASCHGVHDILPSSDPKSKIFAANLPKTCGQCHPGAGTRFALGTIHVVEGANEPVLVRYARLFYLMVIPGVIGFMILHHGGDWIRKLIRLRFVTAPSRPHHIQPVKPEIRMYPVERIQHALLVVSFTVLVWTGFALKYPDQWWARPLLWWEGTWPVRGTIHRVAAAVMIVVGFGHIVSLAASRKLRAHWRELWPVKSDIYETIQGALYSVGLRRTKPVLSPHSYIEKMEYWAVVWGTFIMALTGVALWANNFTLRWVPKEWLDLATTIHFYEAVLATLAIVVWHFYSVIFDPDVYPMDPAWMTGISVRRRESHEPKVPPAYLPQASEEEVESDKK